MRRYEIREEQWKKVKDLLPPERKATGGRPAKDNRLMLNGMLWVSRSGAPWRDLPECYGPWQSVYTRFRRWKEKGVFEKILEIVSQDVDDESMWIDATVIRVHQHGAGAKGGSVTKRSEDRVVD